MMFVVDIVLNFCTGIPYEYGYIEMRPNKIRRAYLRGWFAIDLVACVPLRLLSLVLVDYYSEEAEKTKVLKVLRLLRITRLLSRPDTCSSCLIGISRLHDTVSWPGYL